MTEINVGATWLNLQKSTVEYPIWHSLVNCYIEASYFSSVHLQLPLYRPLVLAPCYQEHLWITRFDDGMGKAYVS